METRRFQITGVTNAGGVFEQRGDKLGDKGLSLMWESIQDKIRIQRESELPIWLQSLGHHEEDRQDDNEKGELNV